MHNVFFLRHFKTEKNILDIISGRNINLPVSENYLIECSYDINIAYCSSALRCKQTISSLISYNKIKQIYYTDQLLERNLGVLENKSRYEMKEKYPTLFFDTKFDLFSTPPNGESYDEFYQRVLAFFTQEIKNSQENILICSHNQFLKMLYFIIKNISFTQTEWNKLSFPNGKVIKIC